MGVMLVSRFNHCQKVSYDYINNKLNTSGVICFSILSFSYYEIFPLTISRKHFEIMKVHKEKDILPYDGQPEANN